MDDAHISLLEHDTHRIAIPIGAEVESLDRELLVYGRPPCLTVIHIMSPKLGSTASTQGAVQQLVGGKTAPLEWCCLARQGKGGRRRATATTERQGDA